MPLYNGAAHVAEAVTSLLAQTGFDPAVGRWYFLDWLVRLSASDVTWSQIPDVVLRRRLHDTNSGLRIGVQHQELLSTLRSGLSRARAPDPSDDVARDSSEHL